jgi:hypothetical protein
MLSLRKKCRTLVEVLRRNTIRDKIKRNERRLTTLHNSRYDLQCEYDRILSENTRLKAQLQKSGQ